MFKVFYQDFQLRKVKRILKKINALKEKMESLSNALTGKGTMLITTNEYLAKRDAEEMGQVYRFLGLTIGVPLTDDPKDELSVEEKKKIYESDIIYTTNGGLGFDYLGDNLASNEKGKFLRPFDYVIIDEIDDMKERTIFLKRKRMRSGSLPKGLRLLKAS